MGAAGDWLRRGDGPRAEGYFTRLLRRGPLSYASWILVCLAAIVLGLPIPFAVAGLAAALVGIGKSPVGLLWMNTPQELVPPEHLGRVLSIDALGSGSLAFVGYGVAGLAADRLGAAPVFVLAGAVSATIIGLGLLHLAVRKLD